MNATILTMLVLSLTGCATPSFHLEKPSCFITADPPGVCCDASIEARLRVVNEGKAGTVVVMGSVEGCGLLEEDEDGH